MNRLFSSVAEQLNMPYVRLTAYEQFDTTRARSEAPLTFLFQDHGHFGDQITALPGDVGWHLIRDPRDVLISGANYHGWSDEQWLHEPRPRLNGRTYQQAIRKLSFEQAVRFEMDGSTGHAIREMLNFDRRNGIIEDVQLETLLDDVIGQHFRRVLQRTGLSDPAIESCMTLYRAQHARARKHGNVKLRRHVQSTDRSQWRYLFTPQLIDEFEQRFAGAGTALGYSPSDPAALTQDPPRRTAYMARFHANRHELAHAHALLDAEMEVQPSNELLIATKRIVVEQSSNEIDRMAADVNS